MWFAGVGGSAGGRGENREGRRMANLALQSFYGIPIAALATPRGLALLILATAAIGISRGSMSVVGNRYGGAWPLELGAFYFVIPVVMLAIANQVSIHNTYADSSYAPYAKPALNTVGGLGVAQLALGIALVWRHRNRLKSTVAAAVVALFWTAGILFVSGMAITGHWL